MRVRRKDLAIYDENYISIRVYAMCSLYGTLLQQDRDKVVRGITCEIRERVARHVMGDAVSARVFRCSTQICSKSP